MAVDFLVQVSVLFNFCVVKKKRPPGHSLDGRCLHTQSNKPLCRKRVAALVSPLSEHTLTLYRKHIKSIISQGQRDMREALRDKRLQHFWKGPLFGMMVI